MTASSPACEYETGDTGGFMTEKTAFRINFFIERIIIAD